MSAKPGGRVFLVGAGPGDPGLLTQRGAHALRTADVLLYDALASDAIVALAPPTCEKRFVGKRGGEPGAEQREIEALMVREARAGKRVVRLKGGDPFVFGRGGEEAQTLRAAGVAFEVVPGISSVVAANAYAGIPVTHRSHSVGFTAATGHEDPTKPESTIDFGKLADPHRTLIFLMAVRNLERICTQLQAHGMAPDTPVAVIQNGTLPSQRTLVGTLATIAEEAARVGIASPAIVTVGGVVTLRDDVRWFDTLPLFGKRILITRPAAQATAFAAEISARGGEAILAPTISIEPPDDDRALRDALTRLDALAWAVFTSRNAVEAVFAQLDAAQRDARAFGRTRIAAIGPQTALALEERGIRADLVPDTYVGEDLANALLAATAPGDAVAQFRAQEARDVISETLRAAGRAVEVVPAYRTALVHDASVARAVARANILTFTSASTVHGYAANYADARDAVEAARGKTIACIGPIAAKAARDAGLRVDVSAPEHTADGLLAALEEFFTSAS